MTLKAALRTEVTDPLFEFAGGGTAGSRLLSGLSTGKSVISLQWKRLLEKRENKDLGMTVQSLLQTHSIKKEHFAPNPFLFGEKTLLRVQFQCHLQLAQISCTSLGVWQTFCKACLRLLRCWLTHCTVWWLMKAGSSLQTRLRNTKFAQAKGRWHRGLRRVGR